MMLLSVLLALLALLFPVTTTSPASSTECKLSRGGHDVILDCTNISLHSLPSNIPTNITVLRLGSNYLTSLPDNALKNLRHLKTLDLSRNRKRLSLLSNSLAGLENLTTLNLEYVSSVDLGCNDSRPFRHVQQLEALRMKGINQHWFSPTCVSSTLRDLSNLKYFSIEWPRYPLPEEFSSLKRLDVLDLSHNDVIGTNFTKDTFKALSSLNITRLALRKHNILSLSCSALAPVLRNLKAFDFTCSEVSDPKLESENLFSPIIACLENSSLEVLILDQIDRTDYLPKTLNVDAFKPLKKVHLKALSIQQNRIAAVGPFVQVFRRLEYLNMDYNSPFILPHPVGRRFWMELWMHRHLKELHLSHAFLFGQSRNKYLCTAHNPLFMKSFHGDRISRVPPRKKPSNVHGSVIKINVPLERLSIADIGFKLHRHHMAVAVVNLSAFDLDGLQVQFTTNIKFLNVSNNYMSSFDYLVYGFDSLEIFDISNNEIGSMNPLVFRAFPRLAHLQASMNRLGVYNSGKQLVTMFSNLSSLQFLDLSANQLSTIPEGMFSFCPNLSTLMLHRNSISKIGINFGDSPNLRLLDLRHNHIRGFSKKQIDDLKNANLTIQMFNNSALECSCDNLAFIEWIQSDDSSRVFVDKDNLTCHNLDGEVILLTDVDVNALYSGCIRDTLIIAMTTVVSAFVCIALLLWNYRWNLRYWAYMMRLKNKRNYLRDNGRRFNVYLSYADDDYNIANTIFKNLERLGVTVFFRDRNMTSGESISDEYFRGIEASDKIILCLTEDYLNSGDQYFELQMSLTRGKGFIIPVLVEDFSIEKLSKPLRRLLKNDIYLEIPKETDRVEMGGRKRKRIKKNKMAVFWSSLKKGVLTKGGLCIRKNGAVLYYAD